MNETVSPWIDASGWKTRWETIDKLPGGGQGDAFRARRLSDGKIGFLKTIKSRNDPERRARFFREASAYDSFGVHGIPRLIESNAHRHADASIVPYIVTEFAEGPTLRTWRDSQSIVRADLTQPDYGESFHGAVRGWLAARLRAALSDPHALPSEADIFKEIKPLRSLEAAASEAARRNLPILAFVYDPAQPERGKLRWSLEYFLQNQRTREIINGAFVTALVPLSAIVAMSNILHEKSMEQARWVVLDQGLNPLDQEVIYANPHEAERIVGELAARHAAGAGRPA